MIKLLVDGKDPSDDNYLFEKMPGDKVKYTVARNGEQLDLIVTLSSVPQDSDYEDL